MIRHRAAVWIAAFGLGLPMAASAATVAFSPANSGWTTGMSFTLDLVGTGFDAGILDGGGVNVSFDPAVVIATAVMVDTTEWEFFSDPGIVDNNTGTITGLSFSSFANRTGTLHFGSVSFQVVGTGVSALGLGEYALNPFTSGGGGYPGLVLSQAGSIAVVPLPPTVTLLVSALAAFGTLRRRNHQLEWPRSPARRQG